MDGNAGSSGIANDGVTEGARPVDGCAEDLRVVAEVERAATLPGMIVSLSQSRRRINERQRPSQARLVR